MPRNDLHIAAAAAGTPNFRLLLDPLLKNLGVWSPSIVKEIRKKGKEQTFTMVLFDIKFIFITSLLIVTKRNVHIK